MPKGVNKVTLLGNVGKDPEIRSTQGGLIIAQFSLATAERRKDNRGEWQDATEWHNLKAFGKTAEIIRDYIRKGSQLYIEGKLQTESWDDKQSGQKRYKTVIIVNDIVMLGGGKGKSESSSGGSGRGDEYGGGAYDQGYDGGVTDDDIPF